MKVSALIEALQQESPDATLEVRRVLGITRKDLDSYEVALDSPIVGLAVNDDGSEVMFIIEAGAHLLGLGKVKHLATGKEASPPAPKACGEDAGYTNPSPVKCQCKGCEGALESTGDNRDGTITFLDCNTCKCCWVVPIRKETIQ